MNTTGKHIEEADDVLPVAPTVNPPSEQSPAVAAMMSRNYRLSGDLINKATADLDDKHRSALRWLHQHLAERDMSKEDASRLLKKSDGTYYSWDSIYQTLTGRRAEQGASLEGMVEAIVRLKKFIDERASVHRTRFVETHLTKKMWQMCQASLMYGRIIFIFGPSQIGKTTALVEYQLTHNHGETVYVRMPTGGGFLEFLRALARVLRISPQLKEWQLRERILASFDDRMLLIVDEAHQVFRAGERNRPMLTLEFIREIHDRTKCGIVLAGTEILEHEMQQGQHKGLLRQLGLRSLAALKLPDRPRTRDLDKFSADHGLEPASGEALTLQTDVIRDHGLGKWCTVLEAASRSASKKSKKLNWDIVIDAHKAILALERGDM